MHNRPLYEERRRSGRDGQPGRDASCSGGVPGSSHEEIAESLGLRKASIKMLLFRARRRLAALLTTPAAKGTSA